MLKELRKRHRIQDAVGRHAALAGHFHAPVHVIELADGVGIRIDAEYAADNQSASDAIASQGQAATDAR